MSTVKPDRVAQLAELLGPEWEQFGRGGHAVPVRSTEQHGPHLLSELRSEFGLGLLFISHDLGVVASVANRVLVLTAPT
jgi:hypothetical protein